MADINTAPGPQPMYVGTRLVADVHPVRHVLAPTPCETQCLIGVQICKPTAVAVGLRIANFAVYMAELPSGNQAGKHSPHCKAVLIFTNLNYCSVELSCKNVQSFVDCSNKDT